MPFFQNVILLDFNIQYCVLHEEWLLWNRQTKLHIASFQCFVSMTFINKYLGCCWAKWGKARQKDETSCKFVEDGPSRRKETGSY